MNVGDKLPNILGLNENNEEVFWKDYKGRKMVLYFYPKDNTTGCTAEACNFREHYDEFKSRGYDILGVSIDNAKSHNRFIARHSLPFSLIADTNKDLVNAMGVWAEKKLYGRSYMGTLRTTFLIDEEGTIVKIYNSKQIRTNTHAEQILKELSDDSSTI